MTAFSARLRAQLLAVLVAAALGVPPAAASAATMSLEAPSRVLASESFSVSASGEADNDSVVDFYLQEDDTSCAATSNEAQLENPRPAADYEGRMASAGQPYSTRAKTNAPAGAWTLCAYLSVDRTEEPDAQASRQVTIVADSDGDGLYDDQDRCPSEFGRDDRTGEKTADGCPIRDDDRDGLRNEDDRCPSQGAQTADGCPPPPPPPPPSGGGGSGGPASNGDADGDGTPDSGDKCPQENANAGTTKEDPANPGCMVSGFKLYLAETYFTFTGKAKPKGAYLTAANYQTTGVERAKSFKILVTLSKSSAKKAKISKREIASTSADVPALGTQFFKAFKKPVASAKTYKKLRKLKKVSFKYTFVVTLVNGQTRTASESYTLKQTGPKLGNATKVSHTVFGPGTNVAGEEL